MKFEINLENSTSVVIEDVLHVPDLTVNFLSISEMTKKENSILFEGNDCKIYGPGKRDYAI